MKEPAWYRALDLLRETTKRHATKAFRTELRRRSRTKPRPVPSGATLLRSCGVAIAYSQGARSQAVAKLIEQPVFSQAFLEFVPGDLGLARPGAIRRAHWRQLSCMRFRKKVDAIVGCAQLLNAVESEHGSFARYLRSFRIPRRLRRTEEVGQFWEGFRSLQRDLRVRRMPFFGSTTSLLQLLLDLDYDSIKPDLIVMRLARRIGVVPEETGDRHFRQAVRSLQEYAVSRGIRASAVDWELLAYGGQTEAGQQLTRPYCSPPGLCGSTNCEIGPARLCMDYRKRL